MRTGPLGVWLCLAVSLVSGCVLPREFPAPNVPGSARLIDVAPAVSEPDVQAVGYSPPVDPIAYKPSNVLVLSGGGMNGAYPAGLLKGWTEAGTRPTFDVVTGISAGALVAPFAFLGPAYDAALERNAALGSSDVYRRRSLAALPWADSLANARPLRRLIEAEITPELLAEVAQAHRDGRRLYVGTTNLDTKRLVVWDMGAIAAGVDPQKLELFRNVVLASCSVPVLLPPVAINVEIDGKRHTELHVDGGVSRLMFLHPQMLGVDSAGATPPAVATTVFVIAAAKLSPDTAPAPRRLLSVSMGSMISLIQAQLEGDLLRLYQMTHNAGARFALAAVPQELDIGSNPLGFDTKLMRQMFEEGYHFGRSGQEWQTSPPGLDPRELPPPRRGVRLTTVVGKEAEKGTFNFFGEG